MSDIAARSPAPRELVCARCGTPFTCRGAVGCWCEEEPYRLPVPALESGEDCLCPACLRAAASQCANR